MVGLEILSEDGGLVFGRGWRDGAENGREDVLVVLPASEQPTPTTLGRLAHEYSFKDELDSAWAVRPLELVRDRGRQILVLEDPGGDLLGDLLGTPMETGRFLSIAIGIAEALGKLHQQDLIHKDIKPANILVSGANDEVRLTGFGIASRFPRERQPPDPPEFIEGTLAYMAPEQTGRMNRSVDSRSDLYSLGVIFYEMLTGSLPFSASDPMEWVHCHIARRPIPPSNRLDTVPAPVSAIVMKLLAKTAEERYQTAAGVERDLRRCLAEWMHGALGDFPPGQEDSSGRLFIPEKLYGREREVETLLASFDRVVKSGAPELVLVSGYSGIGKSSVVNELHPVLVPPRGLFASGKFDQYKRDIPYATLAQAFRGLVRPLLSKNDAELNRWREALMNALGANSRLMTDLVPELKLIVGDQPPAPELPPQDAQRRFQLTFRRFLMVFARPEHPLALFLDDLQWLDPATLDLLEDLLIQPDVRYLLLIGAYRDNEVDAAHPLIRKLETIRRAGATVHDIILAPLSHDDLTQMISESVRCETKLANPLVQLVHEKTGGNPFFAIQFLHALADEALLIFDHGDARWFCDLGRIRAKGYSDNVVDLMAGKISRLPAVARQILSKFACLGNSAQIAFLALVQQSTEEKVHEGLWEAWRAELVVRSEASYRFVHDRIQEAAYSLIPRELRAETHLTIGRLLTAHIPSGQREEAIFDIVGQFDRCVELITLQEEREQVAELYLIAAKRAKAAAAYASALRYLISGTALLTEDCLERRHGLVFAMALNQAECELFTGALAEAEERLRSLSLRAVTTEERVAVACLQVDLYQGSDRSGQAVAVGLRALRHLGVDLPERPTEADARAAYDGIWTRLGDREIEDLIDLQLMSDPDSLLTLDLLQRVAVPGFFDSYHLFSVAVCTAVALGLERGHSDASCIAYVQLGTMAGPNFGQFDAGYRFAKLGCQLVELPGLQRFQARTFETFGFVVPWTQHIRKGRDFLFRGFDLANRISDIVYAGYACGQINTNYLMAGDPLNEAQKQAEHGLAFARKAKFGAIEGWILGQLGLIRSLRGLTARLGVFDDAEFRESDLERELAGNPALALPECWYYIRKLQARFLAGQHDEALRAASRAKPLLWHSVSLLEVAEYHFYDALSRTALCSPSEAEQYGLHTDALAAHQRQLHIWAKYCPENFENRAALVDAEIARIEGREDDAMDLYEQAIRSARENGFVHNEALAHEVAARFYDARGFDKFANAYMREARDCYLRWGADGKVRELDRLYPHLVGSGGHHSAAAIGSAIEHLDAASVVKASQALSSEIELPKLIDRLMTIAIENAGADRGLLILPSGTEYRIEAEARATGDQVKVTMRQEAISGTICPESLVRYVIRTRENVILDDASRPNLFSNDDYLREKQSKSILCLPLIKQRELTGILLIENALTSHAFTADRIAVLELIAAQAAISLENSRLYGDLREREAKIRRLIDSNIIGICVYNLDRRILEANDAFLGMLGYSRDDVISGRLNLAPLTPPEWAEDDARRLAELVSTGIWRPSEKEFFRKDGTRVPVLIGSATFGERRHEGVAFVVDLTERKQAEDSLHEAERRSLDAQMQLAHANRVATMGQLAASLAHEINQPIGAALVNAGTVARWLGRQPPNLEEAATSNGQIINDIRRVADIVSRIRDFSKTAPTRRGSLDINDAILEIMALARVAMSEHSVSARMQLSEGLPRISGDKVQLQQVILNLIMNAVEAMSEIRERSRELLVSTGVAESGALLVRVSDSGPGLPPMPARIFEAFYTTKASGLGMGLSICQSIVEAHGGRLWAQPNEPHGAVFSLILPIGGKSPEKDSIGGA